MKKSGTTSPSSRVNVTLLAVVLAGLLAFAIGIAVYMWEQIGAVDIGVHGTIALVLGVGASLALGIGLMRLVYFSSQRGYDDEVD
jgi:Flp pilus assembly protein protease CpaA